MYLKELIGRLWGGFVWGYELAEDVLEHVNESSAFIRTGEGGCVQNLMWQCLIFATYLLQFFYLQQRVIVHMQQADSDRYLRFLGHFRIVGHQNGFQLKSLFCLLEFGDGGKSITAV
jgi:hypothetical protein